MEGTFCGTLSEMMLWDMHRGTQRPAGLWLWTCAEEPHWPHGVRVGERHGLEDQRARAGPTADAFQQGEGHHDYKMTPCSKQKYKQETGLTCEVAEVPAQSTSGGHCFLVHTMGCAGHQAASPTALPKEPETRTAEGDAAGPVLYCGSS